MCIESSSTASGVRARRGRVAEAELRRPVLVRAQRRYRRRAQRPDQVRRRDHALPEQLLVELRDLVDERAIRWILDVEVGAERAVDEDVDHVREREERLELEGVQQQ